MANAAISQVEDAIASALRAWPALADHTVLTDQSIDEAIDEAQYPAIVIYTVAYSVSHAFEQGNSLHEATVEFEVVSSTPTIGVIGRANHETIAHIIACLAADRSMGGLLQDIQEKDVASAAANGRDVGSASLQASVEFFTSRDDWFTIINN